MRSNYATLHIFLIAALGMAALSLSVSAQDATALQTGTELQRD